MKKTANKWSFLALTFKGKKNSNEDEQREPCLAEFRRVLCAPRKFHQRQSQEEKKNRHTSGRGFAYALLPQ